MLCIWFGMGFSSFERFNVPNVIIFKMFLLPFCSLQLIFLSATNEVLLVQWFFIHFLVVSIYSRFLIYFSIWNFSRRRQNSIGVCIIKHILFSIFVWKFRLSTFFNAEKSGYNFPFLSVFLSSLITPNIIIIFRSFNVFRLNVFTCKWDDRTCASVIWMAHTHVEAVADWNDTYVLNIFLNIKRHNFFMSCFIAERSSAYKDCVSWQTNQNSVWIWWGYKLTS